MMKKLLILIIPIPLVLIAALFLYLRRWPGEKPERLSPAGDRPAPAAPAPQSLPGDDHPLRGEPGEEVLRLNNLGIAVMEQFDFSKAAAYFRQACARDEAFLPGAVNLGIALFYDRKDDESERHLRQVVSTHPDQIHARYVLALLLRGTGREEESLEQMESVLEQDPRDPAALYVAGTLEAAKHRWERAIRYFRSSLERDPLSVSVHYALAKALMQKGDMGEAEKFMARFQDLKAQGIGTSFGTQYLEQGRYSEVVRASGPEKVPDAGGLPTPARFTDQARSSGIDFVHSGERRAMGILPHPGGPGAGPPVAYGSGAAFFDYDGDGWPDLLLADASQEGPVPVALYRNHQDGTFRRVLDSGLDYLGTAMGVAVGDYDNDGHPDVFLTGHHGSALFRNDGKGSFRAVAPSISQALRRAWALSAAFVDADHDGDLDLLVTCASVEGLPARNYFFRNNGNGTFTETGASSGIGRAAPAASLGILDFNRSRDIDILLAAEKWTLLSNKRDGSFADVSARAGLGAEAGLLGLAAGDFDGDGLTDLCAPGTDGRVRIYWNDGEGRFLAQEVPIESPSPLWNARAVDFDNDGDPDLVLAGDRLVLLENVGSRRFQGISRRAGLLDVAASNSRSIAVSDYDRDGDLDLLVTRCGHPPLLLRNDGGERNPAFRLTLAGKADNRSGIGARVEWAAGGLWRRRELDGDLGYLSQSSGEVLLGLGRRTQVDFIRVLWPTGVLQTEIPTGKDRHLHLTELDRKGTSCPILYAWDGTHYRFVTDFLGGSAMGYLVAPGRYAVPDSDEYVKISHEQLRPRGDRLSLKMVNQLEEVILFDRVRLLAVDHLAEFQIFPNERLQSRPPFPEFRLHTVSFPLPILSASDDKGRVWTDALRDVDRRYVEGFRLLPFKGYAEEHALELELGDLRGASRVLLLMDGWIDYPTSSSNFAARQAGLKLQPPRLEVWHAGRWKTLLQDMGFPAGLPKTMTVDLTGKLPLAAGVRIRIVTSMRIYWDRILLETAPEDSRTRITPLAPVAARTEWVGYPQPWSPDGRPPYGHDYSRRDAAAPWKSHAGNYTRFGDVRDLLRRLDDRYVILPHGNAVDVEFPAGDLPALPEGWIRDWLVHVDGFGKDMDLHSQHPDTVDPLPKRTS